MRNLYSNEFKGKKYPLSTSLSERQIAELSEDKKQPKNWLEDLRKKDE